MSAALPWSRSTRSDLPFLERFEAAARCGFGAVELAFPYAHPKEEIAERLHERRLTLVAFNQIGSAIPRALRGGCPLRLRRRGARLPLCSPEGRNSRTAA